MVDMSPGSIMQSSEDNSTYIIREVGFSRVQSVKGSDSKRVFFAQDLSGDPLHKLHRSVTMATVFPSDGSLAEDISTLEDDPEETSNPFMTEDPLSDLTLFVGGKTLYVHKLILATASPVFKAMFFPEAGASFQEKDAKEISLPGKAYDDVVLFLVQIYPQYNHEPLTDDTLGAITALADEYDVDFLVKKCKKYIECQLMEQLELSSGQVLLYLWVCKKYQLDLQDQHSNNLLARLSQFPIQEVQDCQWYKVLDAEDQKDVIFARCQKLELQALKKQIAEYGILQTEHERLKSALSKFALMIKAEFEKRTDNSLCGCCHNPRWSGEVAQLCEYCIHDQTKSFFSKYCSHPI